LKTFLRYKECVAALFNDCVGRLRVFHEGGISTPLIVHWPSGVKARGQLRQTPGHMIDIVPTILDILDIEKPARWEGEMIPPAPGKSLVPALAQDITVDRDFLWWLHGGNRAIRVGDWKLVAAKGDRWELYDLRADRAEANNLAKQQPDKVRQLEALWNGQLKEASSLATKTAPSQAPKKPAGNTKAPR
jgi:arylsulfatase